MPTISMSDVSTRGIRVGATAFYVPSKSTPDEDDYVFGYQILIVNDSPTQVQLKSRHWVIIDGNGVQKDVQGKGVVGEQPILIPGQAFKYASFTKIATTWGTMEGTYQMEKPDGELFAVEIGRFMLTMEANELTDQFEEQMKKP